MKRFYAVEDLIAKHVKDYWKDGLIVGFIGKVNIVIITVIIIILYYIILLLLLLL
jgi:hypothetical protein